MTHTPHPPGGFAGELLVRAGPGKGVCHPLSAPVTLVGRGAECDLHVSDITVRPNHCVLAQSPDGIHLRSLGGPTIVNGLPTLARTLVDGDVIALGPVELQVRFKPVVPDGPPPSAARRPLARRLARGRAASRAGRPRGLRRHLKPWPPAEGGGDSRAAAAAGRNAATCGGGSFAGGARSPTAGQ